MRTLSSLTYTNIALTVLIVLLAALVIKPHFTTPAYAQGFEREVRRNDEQSRKAAVLNNQAENAAAQLEIAEATRDVAAAIRESAKAQQSIASSLGKLGASAGN